VLIYGHRGSPASAPENTLASFQEALKAGVDGLEFDVRASADGELIVIHDRDLARTTSLTGNVDELPFATIRAADAGKGQRVPTLDEVLELVGNRVHLDIEVKQAGLEAPILKTLARHPEVRRALSSFDEDILLAFRALTESVDLIPITPFVSEGLIAFTEQLKSPAVALMSSAYTAVTSKLLAARKLPVIVWTVNDIEEARRVRSLGAHGICTDRPAEIISSLANA
jgi:glycerophosphoryl diester phosphodiesterase